MLLFKAIVLTLHYYVYILSVNAYQSHCGIACTARDTIVTSAFPLALQSIFRITSLLPPGQFVIDILRDAFNERPHKRMSG